MEKELMRSEWTLEIQLKASLGYGWEDILASLIAKRLASRADAVEIRRYVLGLGSAVARRYST